MRDLIGEKQRIILRLSFLANEEKWNSGTDPLHLQVLDDFAPPSPDPIGVTSCSPGEAAAASPGSNHNGRIFRIRTPQGSLHGLMGDVSMPQNLNKGTDLLSSIKGQTFYPSALLAFILAVAVAVMA